MDDIALGRREMREAKATAKLSRHMGKLTLAAGRKLNMTSIRAIHKITSADAKLAAVKSTNLRVNSRRINSAATDLLRLASGLEEAAAGLISIARRLQKKKSMIPQRISFLDLPGQVRRNSP